MRAGNINMFGMFAERNKNSKQYKFFMCDVPVCNEICK